MSIDLKQHVYVKVELDGTGEPFMTDGDIRSCLMRITQFLLSPSARWTKRDGNARMVWTWSNQPFQTASKGEESRITRVNEIAAGLDLTGVEVLDDDQIEAERKPWTSDPRILRLIQINTSREEFENSMPSERVELVEYAKKIWPEFWESFELKHLA